MQPQDPKPPQPPDTGKEQCPLFERDPMKEPDLMAWDATQRQKVHEKRTQGVVAVHMEQSGCDVTARVVDCVGKVDGPANEPYAFSWYYSSDTVLADTQREAYTKLPLGAASLGAELGAGKSLRVDYVMAGSYVLPDTVSVSEWVGSQCGEATHFVNRVVVAGFARASGQRDAVHADVGLFGIGVGAGEQTSRLHWRTEGSPTACKEAEQKRALARRARGCARTSTAGVCMRQSRCMPMTTRAGRICAATSCAIPGAWVRAGAVATGCGQVPFRPPFRDRRAA